MSYAPISRSTSLKEWCKRFRLNPKDLTSAQLQSFEIYFEKQKAPSTKPPIEGNQRTCVSDELINRLVPHWQQVQRNSSIRLLTLFQIYLSKWYWRGLTWYEILLMDELLRRFPRKILPIFKEPSNLIRRGVDISLEYSMKMEEDPLVELQSVFLFGEIPDLLFSQQDFLAVWNLGSFQSLRDKLFDNGAFDEHEGKPNIRKPRIRGYRDGKASPRDLMKTQMALEVDKLFFSEKYEKQWDSLNSQISDMVDLENYICNFLKLLHQGNLKI